MNGFWPFLLQMLINLTTILHWKWMILYDERHLTDKHGTITWFMSLVDFFIAPPTSSMLLCSSNLHLWHPNHFNCHKSWACWCWLWLTDGGLPQKVDLRSYVRLPPENANHSWFIFWDLSGMGVTCHMDEVVAHCYNVNHNTSLHPAKT